MIYLTVKQLSEKWGISERRIINLCRENRINGAIKNGMVWMIPEDTAKPADKRSKIRDYINTEKRIVIVNIDNELGEYIVPLVQKEGYIVEGICSDKIDFESENIIIRKVNYESKNSIIEMASNAEKYYDGLIFIDINRITLNKELLIRLFAEKMNSTSSIVLINGEESAKKKLESKMASDFRENIGLRINAIDIQIPDGSLVSVNYDELAVDAINLLTGFKNSTGMSIKSDCGCLVFDENGRTLDLEVGEFYRAIDNYFKRLDKKSSMWCASTMLEDEWTEEPLEMSFRGSNLEAANRGANLERIFIFSKSKIPEFKNNKTLNIYMQSSINTMFVDYDEVLQKEPELLEVVGDGWDGIDTDTLIVDLPEVSDKILYIIKNKKQLMKAYTAFQRLKEYAKDLKQILK